MANNEYVNEVVYGNQTIISLKNDTVTPQTLMQGATAHDRSGAPIVGIATGGDIQASKTVTAGTSDVTVTPDSGYDGMGEVVVHPTPTETKTESPNVSTNKTVTPSSGKHLSQVTITPMTHSGTYTPAADTALNDMGANHDNRYVDTSGMIVPSGAKSITSNGSNIDVSSYATANVAVPIPSLQESKTVTAGTASTTVVPDSGYDALEEVVVNPTPSQSKSATPSTTEQTIIPDSGKLLSSVSVSAIQTQTKSATPSTTAQTITPDSGKYLTSVSVGAISTETKTQAAGTSNIDVTPTSGSYLTKVTITPQQHSGYYPSSTTNITSNGTSDLGASHNYRYVKVNVTPSLQSKSAGPNVSTNKTVSPDSGYDGLSQVTITPLSHTGYSPSSSTYTSLAMGESKSIDLGANHDKRYVRVQAAAPSGNKSITANGTGIDVASYSTVSVSVPHPTHTTTYTPAANKSNNDMGATHSYRYVNTSGMIVPSGNKSITANGTGIDVSSYATASVAVPDPTLSGTAAKADVLSGATFYNTSTTKQTGTMTNNGAVSKTLAADDRTYTVPAGYHNGSGSVTVPAVTATKRVGNTSTSVDVASDDWAVSLNCDDRLYLSKGVIADGYSQGAVVAASLSSQTGVDSGKTAVTAAKMFSGYQGWVNGSKVSGTYTEPTITDIAPSDSSPVALATTGNYHPTSAGYAIKSSLTNLVPSNSNPAPIYSDYIYKPTDNGYAIGVYQEKTPSTSGASFSAGMVKMSSAGYAYSAKPTPGFTRTTLWTNSSPTSTFAAQTITLSQSMENFDYIEIKARYSTSNTTTSSILIKTSDFQNAPYPASSNIVKPAMLFTPSSGTSVARTFGYASATTLRVSAGTNVGASGSSNGTGIVTNIYGVKFSLS